MDFSLDLPQDWLKHRREVVAQASRKNRQKKKLEREELIAQNNSLRSERAQMLDKLTSLQSEISKTAEGSDSTAAAVNNKEEDDEETARLSRENALLRQELEQHKLFVIGVFQQLGRLQPNEHAAMGELSKQNREFTVMHSLRLLAESQSSSSSNAWKRPPLPTYAPITKPMELAVLYHRSPSTGALSLRVDVSVYHKIDSSKFRDALSSFWEDRSMFEEVFGPGSMALSRELVEFRVEDENEVLKCYHQREVVKQLADGSLATTASNDNDGLLRDLVFLVAKGSMELAKSTLDVTAGGSNFNAKFEMAACVDPCRKRPKLDMVGTAQCSFATRSITEHGSCQLYEEDSSPRRILSTNLEAIFTWSDEGEEEGDDRANAIWFFTFPPSAESYLGGPEEFISSQGRVPDRAAAVFKTLMDRGVAKALAM